MKKFASILLVALSLISLLSFTSCAKAEIDITGKDNVYADLSDWIINSKNYTGKTVALTSTYTVVYNFDENKIIRHTLSEPDESGEKRALYEIRKPDGKYPAIGSEVTVIGTLSEGRYIAVDSISGKEYNRELDIDTLDMSATELKKFVETYRYQYTDSENHGKTVRIFGHLSNHEDYYFLIGLDGDGKYTWELELYDPTGKLTYPKAEGTTVNPVQIIGKLSTYEEDNIIYACIEVEEVARVESVFKSE